MAFEVIDLPGDACRLRYCEAFLSPAAASEYFDTLHRETQWQQEAIAIHGKTIVSPRLMAWYGDAQAHYRYSGIDHVPLAWTPVLQELRARVATACAGNQGIINFNSVLLNLYRNGNDSVGWHSDDEPELGSQPVIASLSLGATRCFYLKVNHRKPGKPAITSQHATHKQAAALKLQLPTGSLLVMEGNTQQYWKHAVLKEPGITAPRINLTFRTVNSAP